MESKENRDMVEKPKGKKNLKTTLRILENS